MMGAFPTVYPCWTACSRPREPERRIYARFHWLMSASDAGDSARMCTKSHRAVRVFVPSRNSLRIWTSEPPSAFLTPSSRVAMTFAM